MLSEHDERSSHEAAAKQPSITLCMVVGNDIDMLEDCLRSVQHLVCDIVIASTRVSDRARDLARTYGALLIETRSTDNRADLRNITLQHAKGDWVLVLDADERLDAGSTETILRAALDPQADAYALVFRNYLTTAPDSAYFVHRTCRMFRNRPEYRFVGKVYERIVPSIEAAGGVVIQINAVVHHHACLADPFDRVRQHDRYMGSLHSVLSHNPGTLSSMIDPDPCYCPAQDFENSLAYLKRLSEVVADASCVGVRR